MSNEDKIKRLQDAVTKFASPSDSGMPDCSELLGELGNVLQELQKSGDLPAEVIEEQMEDLLKFQTLNNELAIAIETGDSAALEEINKKTMLEAGLDFDTFEDEPEIFKAIDDDDLERVKAALQDWSVNQTHGEFDKTALYAAMSNLFGVQIPIIDALLNAGADPKKGLGKTTVLHGLGFGNFTDVSVKELADVVKRCVDLGADIEEKSEKLQWTPLHTALTEWNVVASEALLLAGADPNAIAGSVNRVCTSGQSCLAMTIGYPELFILLLGYGADPTAPDANGQTAFSAVKLALQETDCEEYQANVMQCMDALNKYDKKL